MGGKRTLAGSRFQQGVPKFLNLVVELGQLIWSKARPFEERLSQARRLFVQVATFGFEADDYLPLILGIALTRYEAGRLKPFYQRRDRAGLQ